MKKEYDSLSIRAGARFSDRMQILQRENEKAI